MPEEYGNGHAGPCSTSSSTRPPTLVVSEIAEPDGELVRAFDFPCHDYLCHKRNNASKGISCSRAESARNSNS
jgi:hypothetical protein